MPALLLLLLLLLLFSVYCIHAFTYAAYINTLVAGGLIVNFVPMWDNIVWLQPT